MIITTLRFMILICGLLHSAIVLALPKIAVLDFELRDLTVLNNLPAEIERTASVKPMLEEELSKSGFEIISIPLAEQQHAAAGFGYLLDHSDSAAALGKKFMADYVLVGRLHKPSFLFVYLMVHMVDVNRQAMVGNYLSEVKGGHKKLTRKGVEDLVVKISRTLNAVTTD
jgi:hypothetical protein